MENVFGLRLINFSDIKTVNMLRFLLPLYPRFNPNQNINQHT